MRPGGQVWLRRAREVPRPASGQEAGDCPRTSWARTPALRTLKDEVTSSPGPRASGRTGAGQRAQPCWRATSASRGCPPRRTLQPVSMQRLRGNGDWGEGP